MGGSLLQLVAKGSQDVYLTRNPQISFFKYIFKRHTNFSIESREVQFVGSANPFSDKSNQSVTITVPRLGDLIHTVYLQIELPEISNLSPGAGQEQPSYLNSLGHSLIDKVELEIGGNKIDEQTGEWMELWSQLSYSEAKQSGFKYMLGRVSSVNTNTYDDKPRGPLVLQIPLQFWFCKYIGSALPLVALQFHEVKIIVKFKDITGVISNGVSYHKVTQSGTTLTSVGTTITATDVGKTVTYLTLNNVTDTLTGATTVNNSKTITDAVDVKLTPSNSAAISTEINTIKNSSSLKLSVYIDYVFLDSYERQKMATMKHLYIIEQVQNPTSKNSDVNGVITGRFDFNLNHPIKALYWFLRPRKTTYENMYPFNFSDTLNTTFNNQDDAFLTCKLDFNGIDRTEVRNAKYFRLAQPFQHHTRNSNLFVYVYSFALKPEELQPSGTCNFSRIDKAALTYTLKSGILNRELVLYALNYNYLKIDSGMGGLQFSN